MGLAAVLATALQLVAPQGAVSPPRATAVRVADHAGYVRVVVDFTGAPFSASVVAAADANPFDGSARVDLARSDARTSTSGTTALGVKVEVAKASSRLTIRLVTSRHAFKYLAYRVASGPKLVIDLWKAAPPAPGAVVKRAPNGCLAFTSYSVGRNVRAAGRERNIFEHMFLVVLRGADGTELANRTATASGGRWRTSYAYHATARRPGRSKPWIFRKRMEPSIA